MSEFSVEVVSDDASHIAKAIRLCFAHEVFSMTQVTHYIQDVPGKIIFLWHEDDRAKPLPFPMGAREVTAFVKGWLRRCGLDAYGPQPDCDGSIERGWKISTKNIGFYSVLSVETAWMVYEK
jgi:hypothetical protein